MANGVFTVAKEAFMNGDLDMNTNTIRARLVKSTYTQDLADTSMTPITKITGTTDQTLGSPTIADGVFDAADPTWTAVAGGETITACVVFKFVTDDAGSTPIVWIELSDTATNGSDITVNMDSGANKIFAFT